MHQVKVHAPQELGFANPVLLFWFPQQDGAVHEVYPSGWDDYGPVFQITLRRNYFCFCFADRQGEKRVREQFIRCYGQNFGREIWTVARHEEIYPVKPAKPVGSTREVYEETKGVAGRNLYLPATDVSGKGAVSLLGAHYLLDGTTLFGFFHPRAARVYVTGNFNDWQSPYHPNPEPEKFLPMKLYRGYNNEPNIWLLRTPLPDPADPRKNLYKFLVVGGVPLNHEQRPVRMVQDPYARRYGPDYNTNNCQIIDPTAYQWQDGAWQTPPMDRLIIYELNVYGFTGEDPEIPQEIAGTFRGVTRRILDGYFNRLGVTALALMPTSEAPTALGPDRLGYDPCGFMTIERDFGTCDDFRALVDAAHRQGLAVIVDQVFNHTSNTFNPLWELIHDGTPGGFYFNGETPWGNRVATEKDEVKNMLIDACKMFIREYHVDGFRFDATHSSWMDHRFLHRLAREIKDSGFKPDCLLIAENLPNEPDLNLEGYNGYAQWCDPFHDKIKALLREGVFEDWTDDSPERLGSFFYFCRDFFAAHTNNVINYCESHDEHSIPYEVATAGGELSGEAAKERKSRLGLFATVVALGQPMIYMGQEFGVERPRNRIDLNWRELAKKKDYYEWARRLLSLRRRYPGLRIYGYNPAAEGKFSWLIGPWQDEERGGGRRVIGWATRPGDAPWEEIVVLLNFEASPVTVNLEFPRPGIWVRLADIDRVNDLPPEGDNSAHDPGAVFALPGVGDFTLPSSSGFVFKWEAPLEAAPSEARPAIQGARATGYSG